MFFFLFAMSLSSVWSLLNDLFFIVFIYLQILCLFLQIDIKHQELCCDQHSCLCKGFVKQFHSNMKQCSINSNLIYHHKMSSFNVIFQASLHLGTNATSQFVQKHPTLQRFFFYLQKDVYSANSGDVFSFTLSHLAAKCYQGQRNQTCGRQQNSDE